MIYVDINNPNRIVIGDNPKTNWVQVECVLNEDFTPKYCDYSKIETIKFDKKFERWIITKKYSQWAFYNSTNPLDMRLELITQW